ncbi:hypothetical protein E4U43_006625 [Claviceps pusilla]|uniref:Oxidoreductase-like domain-containing protein n=1 Tax=Claviceps pusilla TaxID=123648 RepID=A0A9P7N282_9HYPO|nr:hypothetical protein E4U43_006625 [Claviceps pusilla]
MSAPTRIATSRLWLVPPRLAASARSFAASCSSLQELPWPQRMPLGEYYTSILREAVSLNDHRTPDPGARPPAAHTRSEADETESSSSFSSIEQDNTPTSASAHKITPATTTSHTPSTSPEPTPQEKARIIFGSRLLGPADQADKLALKQARSTYVAGVLVPPQPEEPDNCCMSGCVNCVWDRFREDMEEWTAKKHEAQARVSAGKDKPAGDGWDDEVYRGVPVGFREFMKQEKRLKEKHAREGTMGG